MREDEITGEIFSLERLFEGPATYAIDYYQREYAWTAQDVRTLITDLCDEFDDGYDPRPGRRRRWEPSSYFLGPFVYYEAKGKQRFLVDGRQRFTTLQHTDAADGAGIERRRAADGGLDPVGGEHADRASDVFPSGSDEYDRSAGRREICGGPYTAR